MMPVGVLVAVIAMRALGMNSNIMSLGGIAISIGVMVDAAIVMIENAHKHIERSDGSRSRAQLIIDACREVGPALFFSLMIITRSEEHTSELQSLMRISYAVFCLIQKNNKNTRIT